jgi:hypothetical protein
VIHVCKGKMIPVETIPEMGGVVIKDNDGNQVWYI